MKSEPFIHFLKYLKTSWLLSIEPLCVDDKDVQPLCDVFAYVKFCI
jgi:hypothetical protein